MSDLISKIKADRSGLERILAKIPGFRGYTEMTARRAADRMIREHIVKGLREQLQRLVEVEKKMLKSGGISGAGAARDAKTQFQIFIDRVNTAAPGYSGFYDARKVGADELENIYIFDAALLEYVTKFQEAIDALDNTVTTKGDLAAAVGAIATVASEANSTMNQRDNVVTQIHD